MEINNILGQNDTIYHANGTFFDKTFTVKLDDATDYPLTDFDGVFSILTPTNRKVLYTKTTSDPELVFDLNTFRIVDKIDLPQTGKLYFELVISHKTEQEKVYLLWYGDFFNEQ